MSTTLKALRQAVGKELNACVTGTADSATSTTIVDADLEDSEESENRFYHWWLKMVSGDAEGDVRRVSAYTPSTGTLTVSRAFSATPAASDEYELHALISPEDLDRLINQALDRLFYMDEQEITAVSGQRNYGLATYTYLRTPDQLIDVLWKQGDTASKYRYRPVGWYMVRDDAGSMTLDIRPYTVSSGDKIVLEIVRPYAALSNDAASTDCPEDWAVAAAMVEVYDWLARTDPTQDAEQVRRWRGTAARRLTRLSNRYAPRPARRIQHKDSIRSGYSSDVAV